MSRGFATTPPPLICSPAQILATDSQARLVCVTAPNGTASPPSCTTALTSDGQKLLCAPVNTASDKDQNVIPALEQLDGAAHDIEIQSQFPSQPAKPAASYVGLTTRANSGDFYSPGQAAEGVGASASLCVNDFGQGAHLCTMDELYQAVVNGALKATDTIPPSWVYMPNWNIPIIGAETPLQGVADNCGGYSYQLSSRRWRGIAVEWGPLPDGTPGFRWHGGDDAYCGSSHKITCCK